MLRFRGVFENDNFYMNILQIAQNFIKNIGSIQQALLNVPWVNLYFLLVVNAMLTQKLRQFMAENRLSTIKSYHLIIDFMMVQHNLYIAEEKTIQLNNSLTESTLVNACIFLMTLPIKLDESECESILKKIQSIFEVQRYLPEFCIQSLNHLTNVLSLAFEQRENLLLDSDIQELSGRLTPSVNLTLFSSTHSQASDLLDKVLGRVTNNIRRLHQVTNSLVKQTN